MVPARTRETKPAAWSEAAGIHIREISANEEASILKSGCPRDGETRTARTEHQIDGLLSYAPRASDIFSARRDREAVLEGAAHQDRTSPRRRPVHNADIYVGGDVSVLKIGLNDPSPLRVRVDDVVNTAGVLNRRDQGCEGRLGIGVPARHEGQRMRPLGDG